MVGPLRRINWNTRLLIASNKTTREIPFYNFIKSQYQKEWNTLILTHIGRAGVTYTFLNSQTLHWLTLSTSFLLWIPDLHQHGAVVYAAHCKASLNWRKWTTCIHRCIPCVQRTAITRHQRQKKKFLNLWYQTVCKHSLDHLHTSHTLSDIM